ncbi:MAG: hypothetical protein WCW84_13930, partial [Sulfurimonas sp.]
MKLTPLLLSLALVSSLSATSKEIRNCATELTQKDVNKAFCDGIQMFPDRKNTVSVGLDVFNLFNGKKTNCED